MLLLPFSLAWAAISFENCPASSLKCAETEASSAPSLRRYLTSLSLWGIRITFSAARSSRPSSFRRISYTLPKAPSPRRRTISHSGQMR